MQLLRKWHIVLETESILDASSGGGGAVRFKNKYKNCVDSPNIKSLEATHKTYGIMVWVFSVSLIKIVFAQSHKRSLRFIFTN